MTEQREFKSLRMSEGDDIKAWRLNTLFIQIIILVYLYIF